MAIVVGGGGMKAKDVIDTRQPLELLNRQSLVYLLFANGIDGWNEQMPKTDLLKIAQVHMDKLVSAESDGIRYKNVFYHVNEARGVVIQRPKEHIEKSMPKAVEEVKEPIEVPKAFAKPGRPPKAVEEVSG